MRLEIFSEHHIAQASALALADYRQERRLVPAMPEIAAVPDLSEFVKNGLGAAALEGDRLVGFLCALDPFDCAFGSTDVRGVFAPMGAHGAAGDREKVYARLYQFAAEKWVRAGAMSHGICLYAHDEAAHRQFFRYGFGQRCVDAIRRLDEEDLAPLGGEYELTELAGSDYRLVYPMEQALHRHFQESPFFMNRGLAGCEDWAEEKRQEGARWFAAKRRAAGGCDARQQGRICAYLEISPCGETFIADGSAYPGYQHVTGAYCLPEHRGSGLYAALLQYAMGVLQREGFTHLGTDYESINPAAAGFWPKYFAEYTCGVVRRIDERILKV